WLDPEATARLLAAYGIPIATPRLAADAEAAVEAARPLLDAGGTVAVKVLSPDIAHKSDVDGVRLHLGSADAVREAARGIIGRARRLRPDARIDGVSVHPMVLRPKAREV